MHINGGGGSLNGGPARKGGGAACWGWGWGSGGGGGGRSGGDERVVVNETYGSSEEEGEGYGEVDEEGGLGQGGVMAAENGGGADAEEEVNIEDLLSPLISGGDLGGGLADETGEEVLVQSQQLNGMKTHTHTHSRVTCQPKVNI